MDDRMGEGMRWDTCDGHVGLGFGVLDGVIRLAGWWYTASRVEIWFVCTPATCAGRFG